MAETVDENGAVFVWQVLGGDGGLLGEGVWGVSSASSKRRRLVPVDWTDAGDSPGPGCAKRGGLLALEVSGEIREGPNRSLLVSVAFCPSGVGTWSENNANE